MSGESENPKPKKDRLDLIPRAALLEMAKGLEEGAEKYAPWDYRRTGIAYSDYIASALRHIIAFADGEDVDPESPINKSHIAGALASLAILADSIRRGYGLDDRVS